MRLFFLILSLICLSSSFAAKLYWIGGTGNWNATSHWSLTSGGPANVVTPSVGDSVYFDGASGLTVSDTVHINTSVNVSLFDFSLAPAAFKFESTQPFIGISKSLFANGLAVFVWAGYWDFNVTTTGIISSNGQVWSNDIKKAGAGSLTAANNISSTSDLYLNAGALVISSRTVTIQNFYSLGASPRSLAANASVLNISGTTWNVSTTNFSILHTGGVINLNAFAATNFIGGDVNYNILNVVNGSVTITNNNHFALLKSFPLGNSIQIANGAVLSLDSLKVNGNCSNQTLLQAVSPVGLIAEIVKTGHPILHAENLSINHVMAVGAPAITYQVALSDTTNLATNWVFVGKKYHWIGNGGNYSSNLHWSFSSGGAPTTCFPNKADSIFFDVLSFSLPNQMVTVDTAAHFGYMNWAGLNTPAVLKLQEDMYSYGNVVLDNQVSITTDSVSVGFLFRKNATLLSNSAIFNVNVSVVTLSPTDSLTLLDAMYLTDSCSFSVFNGGFNSMGHNANFGYFSVINALAASAQKVRFGASNIYIARNFTTTGTSANFQFYAQTSKIYIGSQSSENNLLTNNLTFNEVILHFPQYSISVGPLILYQPQKVQGNNIYNKLRILPGSYIEFESNKTQTIIDSLIMNGTCTDSIYLTCSNNAIPAKFVKNTPGNVTASCVNFNSVGTQGTATFTAYFSTVTGPIANTNNWVFSNTPAITAGFNVLGPNCYNDTTFFANTSTCFTGNPNDVSTLWYFGDGTNTFYANLGYVGVPVPCTPCAGDSVMVVNGVPDTNAHIFASYGNFNVMLISTFSNNCVDTVINSVQISNPDIYVMVSDADTTICQGSLVTFDIGSSSPNNTYGWYLNGNLLNSPPTVNDTLYQTSSIVDQDTLQFVSYENGCPSFLSPQYVFTVNPLPTATIISNDLDNTICAQSPITFTASGAQQYKFLKNNVPVSGFTASNTYTTAGLVNGDVIKVVAKYTATGCVDTSAAITMVVNPLPTVTLTESSGGNVICSGQSVTFTGSGATTYQFFKNNLPVSGIGANVWTTSNLISSDTVEVVGYASTGCSSSSIQQLGYIVNALPTVSMTFNDVDTSICQGTAVNFSATGGVLYEFFINGASQGSPSFVNNFNTNALQDQDSVYVTGVFNGCLNTSSVAIFDVFATPSTALISDDVDASICQQTLVNFTASGAAQYQFYVNGISQGPASPSNLFSTSNLANGQSVVVVGALNGCQVSASIQFTVLSIPNVPLFSNNPLNTICAGQTITFSSAGCAMYQLYVDNLPQGVPQAGSAFIPVLSVGTHQINIMGTSVNGCTAMSLPITAQVNPIPVVTLQSSDLDNIFCSGDNVTITASGATQYQFYINGLSQGGLGNLNTFTSNNFSNGQSFTVLGNSLGCTSTSAPMVFTVNPIPNITLTSNDPNNVFCQGDAITYVANGAASYSFFVNGISQGIASAVNTLPTVGFASGSYQIQVIGTSNGCSNSNSVVATINPNPTVNLTSNPLSNVVCSGLPIAFTAGGANFYQFQVNGLNVGNFSAVNQFTSNNLSNGDVVSVIGTTNLGCSVPAVLPATVVNQTPNTTLTSSELDQALCQGTNVLFTAGGAATYQFFINGVSQGAPSPLNTFNTSTLQDNDLVQVVGSNGQCQDNSQAYMFNVYNYPNVSLTNAGGNQICIGDSILVTALGANNYQFFVNSVPMGPPSIANTFAGMVSNGDVVSVSGETFGCTILSNATLTFTVNTYPNINSISSDLDLVICLNDSVTFTSTGAQTYAFLQNDVNVQNGIQNNFTTPYILHNDSIFVQGFNGTCASQIDTFVFVVNSMNLGLSVTPSPLICQGTNVSFQASGADQYLFNLNGINQGSFNVNNAFVSSSLNDGDLISFNAYNQTTNCYQTYQDSIQMDVQMVPVISALTPTTFCEGDSVILYANQAFGNQWAVNGTSVNGSTDSSLVVNTSATVDLSFQSGVLNQLLSFGYNANGMFANGNNQSDSIPTPWNANLNLKQISSGWKFSLGLTNLNQVYSWGNNAEGQLGNGTFTSTNTTVQLPAIANAKSISTSESSSMVVTTTGGVYVWGNNTYGQLGTGNYSVYNFPYLNPTLNNIDTIVGGRRHFLLLRNDGKVLTVGNNGFGQLGNGSLTTSNVPTLLPGLVGIEKIGAGEFHSFAIDSSGRTFVWGNNASGQLGLDDLNNRLVPTEMNLLNIVQVTGGADFSVFLNANGQMYATGKNNFAQLGVGDFNDRQIPTLLNIYGVKNISCGQYHTLALRNDGSVFGFGSHVEGQLSTLPFSLIPAQIDDLHGSGFIECGKSTSHVITTQIASCQANSINVVVNPAALPPLVFSNGTLSTPNVGVSYQWYFGGQEILNNNTATYAPINPGYYSVMVTYANGCSVLSSEFAYNIQGIPNVEINTMELSPNPTRDQLHISFKDPMILGDLQVFDAFGKIITSLEINALKSLDLDVSAYLPGVYILRFSNQMSARFVVMH